jgi:hypothetical protein
VEKIDQWVLSYSYMGETSSGVLLHSRVTIKVRRKDFECFHHKEMTTHIKTSLGTP